MKFQSIYCQPLKIKENLTIYYWPKLVLLKFSEPNNIDLILNDLLAFRHDIFRRINNVFVQE